MMPPIQTVSERNIRKRRKVMTGDYKRQAVNTKGLPFVFRVDRGLIAKEPQTS